MKAAKDLQVVGFRIGNETFGVPIALVREIVRVPEITVVPETAECVEGVMNLRGKIIPVIDLRKRFREPAVARHKKNRIVVVEAEGKLVGLMVDSASEVIKLATAEVEQAHDLFSEDDIDYVTGLGKRNGRLIVLVDLGKILQRGELKRVGEGPRQTALPH